MGEAKTLVLLLTFFTIIVGVYSDYLWVSVLGMVFGGYLLLQPEKAAPAKKAEFLSGKAPQKEFENGLKSVAELAGSVAHFFVGVQGKKVYSREFDKDYKGTVETHIVKQK
ncbi:MAG TPA: hypothetical protein VJI67_00800 [archaeon]|nr:hypothetical protein [archaeon]HLD81182.1 hypothetical protein [archaeon]